MPERRRSERPGATDRRSFPRPPLWLNLLLLAIAAAGFAYAKHQRDVIREKSAILFRPSPANADELIRIRQELSEMDLTKTQLQKEIDSRIKLAEFVKSEQFYIAVDTAQKKFYLRFGGDVAREANATLGEGRTIKAADGRIWTFVPVKGAFTVQDKRTDYEWPVPAWVDALSKTNNRSEGRTIHDGLGKYVLVLPGEYLIHSPPPPDSPLAGNPKPGSIMVPEEDLAAIWPRIVSGRTRVYIF